MGLSRTGTPCERDETLVFFAGASFRPSHLSVARIWALTRPAASPFAESSYSADIRATGAESSQGGTKHDWTDAWKAAGRANAADAKHRCSCHRAAQRTVPSTSSCHAAAPNQSELAALQLKPLLCTLIVLWFDH